MRFDVVIGNPPYQQESNMEKTKLNTLKTSPIYNRFIDLAILLTNKYISMIIPCRWYNTSVVELNQIKMKLIGKNQLRSLVDFPDARVIFPSVRIAGGVCYFSWSKEYNGPCRVKCNGYELERLLSENTLIRDNVAYSIINRMGKLDKDYLSNYISKNPFNIKDSDSIANEPFDNSIRIKTSYGYGYTNICNIDNYSILNKYKLITGKLLAGGGDHPIDKNGQMKIISGIYKIKPNEGFGQSFLLIGISDTEQEIENLEKYIKSRFVRFLIYCTLSGLNINPDNFSYVPCIDCSRSWDDRQLYKEFNVTEAEQEYIERIIKEI